MKLPKKLKEIKDEIKDVVKGGEPDLLREAVEELYAHVRNYIWSKSPALYDTLRDFVCRKNTGKKCEELLLSNPKLLYELLLGYYNGNKGSAWFTFRYFFIRPLLIKAKCLDKEEELLKMFIEDSARFKEEIHRLLNISVTLE